MDKTDWAWDPDKIADILRLPKSRLKYIITDDRDEFISRLEQINETNFKSTGNNLRYLEQLDKISEIKAGADVEEVFPWVSSLRTTGL